MSGVGAGEKIAINSIGSDDGTYSIEFESDIFGATAGDKCELSIINYQKIGEITNEDNEKSYKTFGIDINASKFAQFLIIPIGYDIEIEYIDPDISTFN